MQVADIEFFIFCDDERYPLAEGLTAGRHLDNDLICAGEDVLDYHLRVERGPRGPRVYPLGSAVLTVNDQVYRHALGVLPGDRLQVGQTVLEVQARRRHPAQADGWWLRASNSEDAYRIDRTLCVGRADGADVLLLDNHISREHARLELHEGAVWLRDLGSANGSFVNGERLVGGCRLFHGDSTAFDTLAFQLVGEGGDLTPVRRPQADANRPLLASKPQRRRHDTTEIVALEQEAGETLEIPESSETGAFLLGASDPVSGLTFRTPMGRTIVGRSDDADVQIRDATVSARHAEIIIRPEGCTVTNLLATNGTRVNGLEVQTSELSDGDVLRLGRVSLVFKDVPTAAAQRSDLRRAQWWLLGGSAALAAVLLLLLVL